MPVATALRMRNERKGKKILLEFEGVYQKSEVYLNGRLAASNVYGYSNFYVPLADHLNYGEENRLKVIVDNADCPNSRWYSGSGIYRKVNLYVGEAFCIWPEGVRITTPETDRVEIRADVTGRERLRVSVFDKGRKVAGGLGEIACGRILCRIMSRQ